MDIENSIEEDMKILERIDIKNFLSGSIEQSNYIVSKADEVNKVIDHILSDYKRVLKENEQLSSEVNSLKKENKKLKEKERKIQNEIHENLSFEKFLKRHEEEPDAYNQGRFYVSHNIYDLLNDVESEE
jgi:cell shape-determining protein MreC